MIEPYRLWWENKNKEPLFAIYNEGIEFDRGEYIKDWMDRRLSPGVALAQGMEYSVGTGDFRYLDEAIALVDAHLETIRYAGDAFPHVELNLGPGVVAAFITGFSRYGDGTVWFEPPDLLSWEDILNIDPGVESSYATVAMEGIERISEHFEAKAVVSQTDLGGVIDILVSLRSNEQLLMDILDCPEVVRKACEVIEGIWQRYFNRIADIIIPRNNGLYTSWMYLLSESRFYPSQCDFSAMISPDAFADVVLPSLTREGHFVGQMVYHLDGSGELPHVDHLLTIENLHAIQWVAEPAMERELSETWYPLYRKIIDAGKKIVIYYLPPDLGAVRKLLTTFPKESFYLEFYVEDEAAAADLLRLRDAL